MQPDGDLISSIDMVDSESRRKKDKSTEWQEYVYKEIKLKAFKPENKVHILDCRTWTHGTWLNIINYAFIPPYWASVYQVQPVL